MEPKITLTIDQLDELLRLNSVAVELAVTANQCNTPRDHERAREAETVLEQAIEKLIA